MALKTSPANLFNHLQRVASVEEDNKMQKESDPLLSRPASFPNLQMRSRTPIKMSSMPTSPSRQRSFTQDIGHAASETCLITGLAFRLLRYLGVGYQWMLRLLVLGFYAMLLLPGFLQVGYHYFFSSEVRRSVVYGDKPRNRLDLYLPKNRDGPKPVLVFVTGGAWIIGYKAWGALLGNQLAERDIIVACLDYRNFPQGTISDMVEDVSQGISFVCKKVVECGGDPNRIFLMGQSAGAHISCCALLEQAFIESEGGNPSWSVSQINAYFGLSGGYNICSLVDHFHRRGLYRSIFLSIMEGTEALPYFSPEIRVQDPSIQMLLPCCPKLSFFMEPQIIPFHQMQVKIL
ncbi:hypothetical protein NMG60_11006230 [Bertholletia excelsa]